MFSYKFAINVRKRYRAQKIYNLRIHSPQTNVSGDDVAETADRYPPLVLLHAGSNSSFLRFSVPALQMNAEYLRQVIGS
jgi:hypothetical protein